MNDSAANPFEQLLPRFVSEGCSHPSDVSALSLAFLSEKNSVNILTLTNVHASTLNEPRAGAVRLDGPPREERNRAHATDDTTGPITLHLILGEATRVAAPSATGLILALSSHGQHLSTRSGGHRASGPRVVELGRHGESARGRDEGDGHLLRMGPTIKAIYE